MTITSFSALDNRTECRAIYFYFCRRTKKNAFPTLVTVIHRCAHGNGKLMNADTRHRSLKSKSERRWNQLHQLKILENPISSREFCKTSHPNLHTRTYEIKICFLLCSFFCQKPCQIHMCEDSQFLERWINLNITHFVLSSITIFDFIRSTNSLIFNHSTSWRPPIVDLLDSSVVSDLKNMNVN